MIKFSEMVNEEISSQSGFKLGLDFHGVIDALPDFFAFLTDAFVKNGGEVHILTGGHWNDEFEKQLNDWGIKFTHKFSVYDHLIEVGTSVVGEIQFPEGTILLKQCSDTSICKRSVFHTIQKLRGRNFSCSNCQSPVSSSGRCRSRRLRVSLRFLLPVAVVRVWRLTRPTRPAI